jgi:hypothetical protein
MTKPTFTPNFGSLMVALFVFLSASLSAQNLTPVAGSTQTISVPSSGFTSFSDPGGPGGSVIACSGITVGTAAQNYPNCACNTVVTVCHDVPGTPVELDFTEFGVNATFDYVIVHNGNSIAGAELYNNTTGGAQSGDRCTGPGLVTATDATGCLTVEFYASGVVEDAGFIANIIAAPVGDTDAGLAITSPGSPTTATLQNVEVEVTNFGLLPLDSVMIQWEINGAPQTSFNYTGPPLANAATSAPIVLGTYTPAPGGVIKAWTTMPNGIVDTIPVNDTSVLNICIGMAGNYTIDADQLTSATNFTTIQGAVDEMGLCGIAGPVVFDIVAGSGPYTEQVTIPEILGASVTNTITFNGNGDTLQFLAPSSAKYTLKLDGADYVTFDSLNILTLDATNGFAVLFSNSSDNNTFRKCVIDASSSTSTSSVNSTAVAFSNSNTSPNTSGNNGSNNLFENNDIIGGFNGVRVNTGGSTNNTFLNNNVLDFYSYGIYLLGDNDNSVIKGNVVSRPTRTTVTTFYGIYLNGSTINAIVDGNRVHNTSGGNTSSTSANYAIYIGADATDGNEIIVSNNLVYDINNNGIVYALYNNGGDEVKFLHNTVVVDNQAATTSSALRGFYQTITATGLDIIGNIFYLSRTGSGSHTGIYINTSATTFTANYNVVYLAPATASADYGYFGTAQTTLANWQAAGYGANSLDVNPLFASIPTFDFTPGNPSFNNIVPNQGITVDFNGTARGVNTDPGAIEFTGVPNDIGVFNFVSPLQVVTPGSQSVDVEVRNFGTNTINTYDVQWSVNGVGQTPFSSATPLLPSTNSSPLTLGTYTPSGVDTIRAWTVNPNGGADAFAGNDTLTTFTCIGLQGVFSIDAALPTAGTNFASFTDAVAAMTNCGITGPVTFNVTPGSGPYNEQVIIPAINGMGSANPITFNGNGDTLEFAAIAGARHILLLDGAKYVTIDSLVIRSLSGVYGYGIQLENNADNNTIVNSTIDLSLVTSTTSTNSAGIVFSASGTSPISTVGPTGSNNLVEGNTIIGGFYGLTVYGPTGGTATVDNQILNNTLEDYYSYGIYLGYNTNTLVQGNDISRPTRTAVTTHYGIYATTSTFGARINANRVHTTHGGASSLTSSTYGIYFTGADADTATVNVVSNNLLYNFGNSSLTYAIYNSSSNGMHVLNNTVVLDNQNFVSTSIVSCFYQVTLATNVVVKNNIFYNTTTGTGAKYGSYMSTSTSDIVFNKNVYYINSPTGTNSVGYYTAAQATLADWQAANTGTYDLNSFFRDPRFASAAAFDFTPAAALFNNTAEPLAEVPFDFFGTPRGATPDPGAIEYAPAADDAAPIELLSPSVPFAAGTFPITTVIQNLGIATLTEVNVYVNIKDGIIDTTLPVFIHNPITLASLAKDTIILGTFDFTSPAYTITIFTSDPNGGPDANPVNDTLVVNLCLALPAGNYTINSALPTGGGNYQTFNDVVAALGCGILGNVVFTVAPGSGPYSEQVTIGQILGSGPTGTITFEGSGDTLTHDGSVKYATVVLSGTDYVTFDNLTIQSTATVQGFGIQLNSEADHNTVKNCTISMSTTTTSTINAGINASASETSAATDGNNANYLLVDSCTFIGGYRGVDLQGSSTVLLKGNRITNNTFLFQDENGINVDDQDSLIVFGNFVDSLRDQVNADGIYLFDINGYFEVENNIVRAPDWGIYFNDGNTADSTRRAKITNNMVTSNADYALYFVSCSHIDVFHNTAVGNSAIYLATNTARLDIRNNIFYSPSDYAFEYAVALATANPVDIDNNLYYSGNSTLLIRYGGTTTAFDYASLADWQTAFPTLNQGSLQGDPGFVGADDLHVLGLLANDVGDNSVGIAVDIDGDTRPLAPSTTVDIGADEYTPAAADIQLFSVLSPVQNACGDSLNGVIVVIYNQGTQAQSNFDVTVDFTGAATQSLTTTYAGPLASQAYDTIVVGSVNTYAGGIFNLTAYHSLTGDQYTLNDTLTQTVEILAIPAPPVAVGDTGCIGDVLELTAGFASFLELDWYSDAALTNSVGSGDVFFTPSLSSSQTYYVVGTEGFQERAGKPAPTSTGTFITATAGWGLEFEVTQTTVIDSVTIYPVGTGTVSIGYYDLNAGNALVEATLPTAVSGTGATTPVQVYLGWTVAPGRYNIGLDSYTGITNLIRDSGGNTFPYAAPTAGVSVTAGKTSFTATTTSSYYWFYDWVVGIPGCSSPATEVFAFISEPVSEAGPDDTICAGETATLVAQNGVSWNWTGGLTTQSIDVSPASTTTYNLTITDVYGCAGTVDFATAIVNQLPAVNAGSDTTICDGQTATFGAIGATDFVWSNTATTPTTDVTVAGLYSVIGTDANGCVNTDTVELFVRALPSGNAGADGEICVGGSTQLLASGGLSYVWSTTETTAAIVVSPTATTDYALSTTDQFGCVGEDTVTVVVNDLPVITLVVTDTFCVRESNVTLVATPAGGTFSGPGVLGGIFDATVVGVGTYNITYNYTDGNGCSNSATKQVYVDGAPGCYPNGIGNIAGIEMGGVYPNPFQDKVTIEFVSTTSEPVFIRMYDLLGQQIYEAEVTVVYGFNTYIIDTERTLAEGFYVIELRKGEQSYIEKLLRVR